MSLSRAVLSGACLALLLSSTVGPAHTEGRPAHAPPRVATVTGNGASSWVRVCDRGRVTGKDKDGKPISPRTIELCATLTEQFHPDTGKLIINASLQHVKL